MYMCGIRKYKDSDLQEIFAIYSAARQGNQFTEPEVESAAEFISLLEGEDVFILQAESKPIAFISVYPEQSFIHHLYVHPEHQRNGLGSRLLDYVRNKYEHPLSLKCEKTNIQAVSFYKRSGWKIFKSGSEKDGTEYILMTLDLN